MQKRFFLVGILFLFSVHAPLNATDLKMEIIKIKDSGTQPFWSPDGKEIVFIDEGGLFIISVVDSVKERKIANGYIRTPRWSPDGKYIAYVDRDGIKIISPWSGQAKLIYPDNKVQMPMWSPDSKWITFYLSELQGEEGSGVFAVNVESLKTKQLSYRGINPCWSGDGKSVFYFIDNAQPEGFGELFLTDLDNSEVKKLASIGGVCMNFNSEGSLLAFAPKRKDGTSLGIYLASPFKHDEPIKLSDDGYFPSFSFNGRWVSFFKYDPQIKNTKVYITSLKGGELIEIGNGIYPRWSPNKRELVYEMLGVKGGIYVAKLSD